MNDRSPWFLSDDLDGYVHLTRLGRVSLCGKAVHEFAVPVDVVEKVVIEREEVALRDDDEVDDPVASSAKRFSSRLRIDRTFGRIGRSDHERKPLAVS